MTLAERVAVESGQPIALCYQCRKCTAGCPTALDMDLPPHEVVRRALLGEDETVLGSSAIWLCVGCGACGERCPNGISLGEVMPALRRLARERGVAPGEKRTAAFHAASAASARETGRLHEAGLLLDYARRAFLGREGLRAARELAFGRPGDAQEGAAAPSDPWREGIRGDVRVGLTLVLKRKLPLKPSGGGPRGGLRELFARCVVR